MVKDTRKQVVIKLQNDEYERLLAAAESRGTSLYKFCLESMRRDLLGIQADTQPASPQAIDSDALTTLVDTRIAETLASQSPTPPAPDPALSETVAALLARVEAVEQELKNADGAIAA
jgi:hypothetical protein